MRGDPRTVHFPRGTETGGAMAYHKEGRDRLSAWNLPFRTDHVQHVGVVFPLTVPCHRHQEKEPFRPSCIVSWHGRVFFIPNSVAEIQ